MPEPYYLEYLVRTDQFPQSIYHQAKHDYVRQLITALPKGTRILDAACGIGHITAPYTKDYQIIGSDIETPAATYARRHYDGSYVNSDLYHLPFKTSSFDLVLYLDAIEHLFDPPATLKELRRVLKPRHQIMICTINYANPLWFILENTWHRLFAGPCKTYSKEVHPSRYTAQMMLDHCEPYFKTIRLDKKILQMELFYVGEK